MKNHEHEFRKGNSGSVEVCSCGKFRFTEEWLKTHPAIVERRLGLPDLSRTKAAIEAYDAFDATFEATGSQEEVLAQFAELERLGEAVGIAFGLDTADRNSMDACKQCIRPGPKVPAPGAEPSFVRRMVARWEANQ